MLRIAVYGSLREGMGNSGIINDAKKLSTEVVKLPFEMIDMGSFPGLVKSNEVNDIVMEIYEVDLPTYRRVERLEGYPNFYDKHTFESTQGTTEVYVLNETNEHGYHTPRSYEGYPRVTKTDDAFDWVQFHSVRRNRY